MRSEGWKKRKRNKFKATQEIVIKLAQHSLFRQGGIIYNKWTQNEKGCFSVFIDHFSRKGFNVGNIIQYK